MWFIYALSGAVGAAIVAILIKVGLQHVDTMVLTLIFFAVMFVSLFLSAVVLKKIDYESFVALSNKEWLYLGAAGIVSSLSYFAYILALQQGETCSVVAINRLDVLCVVLFSTFLLSGPFSLKMIVGALLMALGAFLLAA